VLPKESENNGDFVPQRTFPPSITLFPPPPSLDFHFSSLPSYFASIFWPQLPLFPPPPFHCFYRAFFSGAPFSLSIMFVSASIFLLTFPPPCSFRPPVILFYTGTFASVSQDLYWCAPTPFLFGSLFTFFGRRCNPAPSH